VDQADGDAVKFWYRGEVEVISARHALTPDLVQAVCLIESEGLTCAYRPEPKFWDRYMRDKQEWDGANPARVSASYGLMQVMYPTALEHGYPRGDAPEGLFVPIVGLEYGCRVLAKRLEWAAGDLRATLASYNGGKTRDNAPGVEPKRNEAYVVKVMTKLAELQGQRLTHE
jgi:hypothetical protein